MAPCGDGVVALLHVSNRHDARSWLSASTRLGRREWLSASRREWLSASRPEWGCRPQIGEPARGQQPHRGTQRGVWLRSGWVVMAGISRCSCFSCQCWSLSPSSALSTSGRSSRVEPLRMCSEQNCTQFAVDSVNNLVPTCRLVSRARVCFRSRTLVVREERCGVCC